MKDFVHVPVVRNLSNTAPLLEFLTILGSNIEVTLYQKGPIVVVVGNFQDMSKCLELCSIVSVMTKIARVKPKDRALRVGKYPSKSYHTRAILG